MSFSLANALATFQYYIKKSLAEKLNNFCIVYLDEILVFRSGKTDEKEKDVR